MERFQALQSSYYRKAAGVVIMYDVTELESFKKLDYWLDEIDRNCPEGVKKIMVGNKTDMASQDRLTRETIQPSISDSAEQCDTSKKKSRAVSEEMAKEFAQRKNIAYVETSVKHNDNVAISLEYVVQQVLLDPNLWKRLYPVKSDLIESSTTQSCYC